MECTSTSHQKIINKSTSFYTPLGTFPTCPNNSWMITIYLKIIAMHQGQQNEYERFMAFKAEVWDKNLGYNNVMGWRKNKTLPVYLALLQRQAQSSWQVGEIIKGSGTDLHKWRRQMYKRNQWGNIRTSKKVRGTFKENFCRLGYENFTT